MKWAWAVAAIPLAWAGCKPQAAPPPRPTPCRVDLSRLVSAHPRWPEVRAMDARIRRLQERLSRPQPPAARAALPPPLAPIAHPEPPRQREIPASVAQMEEVRSTAMATLRKASERRHQARLEARRAQLALDREQEARIFRDQAFEQLWQEQLAIIRRHQSAITNLHILIALRSQKPVIPGQEKARAEDLAKAKRELAEIERRRKAELQAVHDRVFKRLDEEQQRRDNRDAAVVEEMHAALKSQLAIALRTADTEWQERVDAATAALQEPPPGPVVPADGGRAPAAETVAAAGVKVTAPAVTVTPAAGAAAPDAALDRISRQRAVLVRFLRAETRARVLGIAARYNLSPRFGGAPGLPDRTEFFLKQIQRPGS